MDPIKDMEHKLSRLRAQLAAGENVTREQIRRAERALAAARKAALALDAARTAFEIAFAEGR